MYKATLSLAILAVARLALAQPYCLLTAVNKFEHPADQKTLCCKEANKVESYLEELCPSSMQSDAKDAFKTACQEAGYGDCSKSDESSSSKKHGSSEKGSHSGTAPYPVVYTTTFFDKECSCTKTHTTSSTSTPGSSGFATGTAPVATGTSPASPGGNSGSGAGATGSPISPASPSSTGSGSKPFTGAASRNVGSLAAGLLAMAGVFIVM